MTQRKSLARKLIVLFIVLVILIPCSVLVYDTVVSSNEERVDFYYMMSDGGMGALKKKIPRTDREELLTIYSIVNSLCELDQIDRVQFLVEGKKLDTYKDNLQFKTPFTAVDSIRRLEEK